MHDESGPPRLRQGNDTPEALLRVIDALRKGVDDSARLSRVGQKLQGVLNAPPAAAPLASEAAQRGGLFGQKLSTLKLVLGGLALLVALTPLFFLQHADDGAVPGADHDGSSDAASSATAQMPSVVAAPQPEALEHVAAIEENTLAVASTDAASVEPSQHSRRGPKHAARTRERANVHEAPAEHDEASAESDVKNSPTKPAPAARDKAQAATPPSAPSDSSETPKDPRSGENLKQPEEAPAVPAEADLLLKARKALKLDPSLALRLAAEHQAYYPKGRLVPEREVLAIEALRNLGRKQEADERLKKFEARYPKSIHLQRLHEAK